MTPLITIDPAVMDGKPCIFGTRITVELILDKLAAGCSMDSCPMDEIHEAYPHLPAGSVRAAIEYAANVISLKAF